MTKFRYLIEGAFLHGAEPGIWHDVAGTNNPIVRDDIMDSISREWPEHVYRWTDTQTGEIFHRERASERA